MMSHWGQAIRRALCCGSGADADEASTDEPIYEIVEQLHQTHGTVNALQLVVEAVDELRQLLVPIADVPERMRRLELHLHPLLVYRSEEGDYVDMTNGLRPAPAAEAPEPPPRSIWLQWLRQRINYGEPW